MKRTAKEVRNDSNVKALRRIREFKGLSRKTLASRLKVSVSAVEKYERGVDFLSDERLKKILNALEVSYEQLLKVKRGKGLNSREGREKTVMTNSDRRSYKKIITKECKVLRSMRRIKKISQDKASALCGYPRATIGHIENGRIELSRSRIKFIVEAYGYKYSDFEDNLNKAELRDSVEDFCIKAIEHLNDSKLEIVRNLLSNL